MWWLFALEEKSERQDDRHESWQDVGVKTIHLQRREERSLGTSCKCCHTIKVSIPRDHTSNKYIDVRATSTLMHWTKIDMRTINSSSSSPFIEMIKFSTLARLWLSMTYAWSRNFDVKLY